MKRAQWEAGGGGLSGLLANGPRPFLKAMWWKSRQSEGLSKPTLWSALLSRHGVRPESKVAKGSLHPKTWRFGEAGSRWVGVGRRPWSAVA